MIKCAHVAENLLLDNAPDANSQFGFLQDATQQRATTGVWAGVSCIG